MPVSKKLKFINKIPFAPVVGIAFGFVTAILVFAIPAWRFAQMIVATGLPSVLSAARPPLGDTARALVAISLGLAVCAGLWIGLSILRSLLKRAKSGQVKARGTRIDPVIVAKAPAAPDSLPSTGRRRPIFAESDLGAPFMSDEILRTPSVSPIVSVESEPSRPVDDELVLDTSWEHEVPAAAAPFNESIVAPFSGANAPSIFTPFAPMIEPTPAPVAAPVAAAAEPKLAANQSLSDLIVRLDCALEARNQREAARPSGDIVSLRDALSGLAVSHR